MFKKKLNAIFAIRMMNFIIYILVYPLIWILSLLPFRILYLISDGIFVLLFHVIGYRKKVVYDNLKLVFPNKSEKEILSIRKKFYRHFVDVFIEMIKSFTISKKEINKRYKYLNLELINDLSKDNKSLLLYGSHYANWEWMVNLTQFIPYKGYAAYTKVGNKYFNNAILKSRSKLGATLKPTNFIIKEIELNLKNNIQSIYGLLSDQSPQIQKTHYWGNFLGVKVPIHTGTEMLAKKHDLNVMVMTTKKIKRGFYENTFTLITTEPKKYADYEITDIYLRALEAQIYEEPAYYFWTHKRFKHKEKAPK